MSLNKYFLNVTFYIKTKFIFRSSPGIELFCKTQNTELKTLNKNLQPKDFQGFS